MLKIRAILYKWITGDQGGRPVSTDLFCVVIYYNLSFKGFFLSRGMTSTPLN